MGSLFTEDGVELWKDWVNGKASQTRALKEMMRKLKPVLLIDIHNDSPPTRLCPPTERREEDKNLYRKLQDLAYDALEKASIPLQKRIYTPYRQKDDDQSVCWAYNNFGTIQFLYEVNGLDTKEHMVFSVWYRIIALVLGIISKLDD